MDRREKRSPSSSSPRSASPSPSSSSSPRSSFQGSPSSSTSPSIAPKYNEIFLHLGDWGRWQKTVFVLVSVPIVFCAIHTYLNSFTAGLADHRCLIPGVDDETGVRRNYYNRSEDPEKMELLEKFIPKTKDGKFSQCERFFESNSTSANGSSSGSSTSFNASNGLERGPCVDGWVFNHDTYGVTIIENLQLVCERQNHLKYLDVATMVGMLFGAISFGKLSDSIGRQTTLMVSLFLQTAVAIATAYSPNFGSYLVFRCLVGAFLSGVFNTAFCLAMECVGPSQRTWVGIGVEIFWAAGVMILSGFAFLLPNFQHLQLAMSVPLVLFFPYIWVVPESPRWLLLHGYYDRFRRIMLSAARANGLRISHKILEQYTPYSSPATSRPDTPPSSRLNQGEHHIAEKDVHLEDEEEEERLYHSDLVVLPSHKPKGLLYCMTRPLLVLKTLSVFFNWFVNTLVYYGLTMNSVNLNDNPHLNVFVSGAVEIPAYIFCILVLNKLGRKPVLVFVLLFCGATLFASIFVPVSNTLALTILSMIGKGAISASFAIIYVFSAELFPTVVRNVAMGACAMFARFGGIIAPVIADLGSSDSDGNKDPTLPLAIFGCFSLSAGLFALWLPETMNRMLPETIEDFEEDGLVNPFRCGRDSWIDERLEDVDLEKKSCPKLVDFLPCAKKWLGFAPCPPKPGAAVREEEKQFQRTISFKEDKKEGISTYEPERIPSEDKECHEYFAATIDKDEQLDKSASKLGRDSSTSTFAAASRTGNGLQQRRHTVTSRVPSTPKNRRYDEATINRGNAMLQAAVSMTFSVSSFHNSDVEVYPVHPRVVETSFRQRAASAATEFRTRVNSVTAMRSVATAASGLAPAAEGGGGGGAGGRMRSATVNGALLDEAKIKTSRLIPSMSRMNEGRVRSGSLFGANPLRAKDLRKQSVDELEEEASPKSEDRRNANNEDSEEGRDSSETNSQPNFFLEASIDDDSDSDDQTKAKPNEDDDDDDDADDKNNNKGIVINNDDGAVDKDDDVDDDVFKSSS